MEALPELGHRRTSLGALVACAGVIAFAAVFLSVPASARHALDQAWPPFALVSGLLLIGAVAAKEGLFEMAGAWVARLPGGVVALYLASMLLVVIVTVILTLDTAVVFLTPILVHMARRRGVNQAPFVYGCVFMSNSSSLLLPGSNLTNLIVLSDRGIPGGRFAAEMTPGWLAAIVVTALVTALAFRLRVSDAGASALEPVPNGFGIGSAATAIAVVLVLVLSSPALFVLALGLIAAIASWARDRTLEPLRVLDVPLLGGLFGVMVGLGAVARVLGGPAHLMETSGRVASAAIGAGTSILINNLPGAVLLSSGTPAHPRALLLGLNIGPNLAVTGSLSAIFWLQVARSPGAEVSASRYSLVGALLTPMAIAAALIAGAIFAPASL